MKKIVIAVLFFFLIFSGSAFAEISEGEKNKVTEMVEEVVSALNQREIGTIVQLVPEDSPTLRAELSEKLEGMTVQLDQDITAIEEVEPGRVKVSGSFAAQGIGWETSGLSNYYVFEQRNGEWFLVETDFHKKLGPEYVFEIVGKISLFIIPVMIAFEAFWLWMLIDAIKRKFDEKTTWIVVIILGGGLGAILYFFIARRKLIKQGKPGYQGLQQPIPSSQPVQTPAEPQSPSA